MHQARLAIVVTLLGCAPPSPPCPPAPPAPTCPAPPARSMVREGFVVKARWPDELSRPAFDALAKRAAEEHTTALVVLHEGKLLHESNPLGQGDVEQPSWVMSVSKSVVALLVGRMVGEKLIELDRPLSETVIPEWRGGDKAAITPRHLLSHTSGMDATRAVEKATKDGTVAGPIDIEKHGIEDPLAAPVGTEFAYNTAAVDFLSVVVRRATKLHLDDAAQALLFRDLGMVGAYWPKKDVHGDPWAGGELKLRPIDLAKLGELVLARGMWRGRRLLEESWIDAMLAPSPLEDACGLSWWRRGRGKKGEPRQALAYVADGYLGQYLVVVPDKRLVVVRLRDPERTSWKPGEWSYRDFMWDVLAVAGHDIPEGERR